MPSNMPTFGGAVAGPSNGRGLEQEAWQSCPCLRFCTKLPIPHPKSADRTFDVPLRVPIKLVMPLWYADIDQLSQRSE